jgi:hypothetical protein
MASKVHKLDFLEFIAPAFLGTVADEQDLLCRVLGDCVYGSILDSELGDQRGPGLLAAEEKKFRYLRYNREFTAAEMQVLKRESDLDLSLDNIRIIPYLQQTGRAYAAEAVQREHFFPSACQDG